MIVTDGRGRPARAPGLALWLARVAPARARGEVAIAVVSDTRMQALNTRFRHTSRPTDVLSFPAEPSRTPLPASCAPHSALGDIVIAAGVARRQARRYGHPYPTELKILALHGLLHLLGYDHERHGDRSRMRRIEARLRRRGGLREGLIERAEGD
ncbi:MAG TPA: rRNA maturation RNase YbeY [Vicinamibacterales bacterium]